MASDREFAFKEAQIKQFMKKEYNRYFGRGGRISIRKRQRFMDKVTQKVSKRFGKDVLCLVDFTKQGFETLISPAKTESTDKGRLFKSFIFPQVAYTTHCIDRFSQRTQTEDNCIISLDTILEEAILTFGQYEGYLVGSAGIFAYEIENHRLIIKTFINFELLSEEQIRKFYRNNVISMLSDDMVTEDSIESDIILTDELPSSTQS